MIVSWELGSADWSVLYKVKLIQLPKTAVWFEQMFHRYRQANVTEPVTGILMWEFGTFFFWGAAMSPTVQHAAPQR